MVMVLQYFCLSITILLGFPAGILGFSAFCHRVLSLLHGCWHFSAVDWNFGKLARRIQMVISTVL
jgi:hypothetical protein